MQPVILSHEQVNRFRTELKRSRNSSVYKRATALLAANQGVTVSDIASLLGVTRQTVYNWIDAYSGNQRSANLNDAPRSGRPRLLTEAVDASIVTALESSPADFGYSSDRWNASTLRTHVSPLLSQEISNETLRRRLHRIGYSWKRGRYVRQPETAAAAA
jgi:transposase